MNRDKRRNEAPEDRRNYEDKLNKREARAETQFSSMKKALNEIDTSGITGTAAVSIVIDELSKLSSVWKNDDRSAFSTIMASTGKTFIRSPMSYYDEFNPGASYLTSGWPGYEPEPEGLTGKVKKRWHHVQFKKHKAWIAWERGEAEREAQRLREEQELEEITLHAERADLGWGGF